MKKTTKATSVSQKPISPEWQVESEKLIKEVEQAEQSLNGVNQTTEAEPLDNVKRDSLLFPDESEIFKRKGNSFESRGRSPVKFAELVSSE